MAIKTDKEVLNITVSGKHSVLGVGGLYLELLPTGLKSWRLKYTFNGKEKRMTLGKYNPRDPLNKHVGLEKAKQLAYAAKIQIDKGVDPMAERKAEKKQPDAPVAVVTFKTVALEFVQDKAKRTSAGYIKNYLSALENHVFPLIGNLDIATITPMDMKRATKEIESKKTPGVARTALQQCREVFDEAIDSGRRVAANPATRSMTKSIQPVAVKHNPHVSPEELPEFIRDLEEYMGFPMTKLMIKFIMLTGMRTGEVRDMKVQWLDFKTEIITVPEDGHKSSKRKVNQGLEGHIHFVPMSRQMIKIIKRALEITGNSGDDYVFPAAKNKHEQASENAVTSAIRKSIGNGKWYKKQTSHGFRGLARTAWNKSRKFQFDEMEKGLAHVVHSATVNAYLDDELLEPRREMLQWWADELVNKGMLI